MKDLSELRITHNMNIEDQSWDLDERLKGSTADKLKGCEKFFEAPPMQLSSILSRRATFLGESSFKDFRDYLRGSVTDFSVVTILQNMDKFSHLGGINKVIIRNSQAKFDGQRNVREQARQQFEQFKIILRQF